MPRPDPRHGRAVIAGRASDVPRRRAEELERNSSPASRSSSRGVRARGGGGKIAAVHVHRFVVALRRRARDDRRRGPRRRGAHRRGARGLRRAALRRLRARSVERRRVGVGRRGAGSGGGGAARAVVGRAGRMDRARHGGRRRARLPGGAHRPGAPLAGHTGGDGAADSRARRRGLPRRAGLPHPRAHRRAPVLRALRALAGGAGGRGCDGAGRRRRLGRHRGPGRRRDARPARGAGDSHRDRPGRRAAGAARPGAAPRRRERAARRSAPRGGGVSGGRARGWRAIALLAAALAAPLAALDVPFLSGRVVDLAGLLTESEKQSIEQKLAAFEKKTGAQIAVLTLPGLEGEPLEDYSMRVVETWKLGRAGEDDGALLLVARDDRKMRIEVGRGLEDRVTDLVAGRILDHVMRPLFREGKFGPGIEAGVDALLGTLEGLEVVPEEAPASPMAPGGRFFMFALYLLVVGVFSLIAILTTGPQSW